MKLFDTKPVKAAVIVLSLGLPLSAAVAQAPATPADTRPLTTHVDDDHDRDWGWLGLLGLAGLLGLMKRRDTQAVHVRDREVAR